MRIRKEISKWSVKTFLKLAGILLLIFNGFYLITAWLDGALDQMNTQYILMFCVFYPVLLALFLTSGFRTSAIFINDYENIPDFKKLLDKKIVEENMIPESHTPDQTLYKPGNSFYKLFNAWGGSEKLTASWGKEIVISGSLRKVSALEDGVRWSEDFKASGFSEK